MEIVNFRLTARGRLGRPPPPADRHGRRQPTPVERRDVCFARRARCRPRSTTAPPAAGPRLLGPAVIEQIDATTLVFPGDHARVDAAANLLIEIAA